MGPNLGPTAALGADYTVINARCAMAQMPAILQIPGRLGKRGPPCRLSSAHQVALERVGIRGRDAKRVPQVVQQRPFLLRNATR